MSQQTARWLAGAILAIVLAACGQPPGPANQENTTSGGTQSSSSGTVQTSTSGHAQITSRLATPETGPAPYDARFIDSMREHHLAAITMAEQALQQSKRPEIQQLAQTIIMTQLGERDQLKEWRTDWFFHVPETNGLGMSMGDMQVSTDASKPFDRRFIEAMLSHHQAAITMAQDAQRKAEHPELKRLAATIVKTQKAEVKEMQQWQREWFGS